MTEDLAEEFPDLPDELPEGMTQAQLQHNYRRLAGVVSDYRETTPEAENSQARVKRRVLDIAELELAAGPSLTLSTATHREFSLAVSALKSIIRTAVDAIDGLFTRRVRATQDPHTEVLRLDISLSMAAGTSLPQIESNLRDHIHHAVNDAIGATVVHLNLRVEDIHRPKGDTRS